MEASVNFKMLSLNVRGICSLKKRKAVLIWLNKQNADIFLQETYSTKEIENSWRYQWKGPIFFAHDTNRSCGVLILVKDSLEFEMNSVSADENGRYILLNTTIQGAEYLFGNLYALNKVKEQCSFFEELQQNLDDMISHPNQRVVLGRDFYVIHDPDLDSSGGSPTVKESVKLLQDICLNYDLIDIWRIHNPDAKSYTRRQKKPLIQRRQISG